MSQPPSSEGVISADEVQKANVTELLQRLSSSENGLSATEASRRLDSYGPNEITEKRVNPLLKFITYFWGPIPWMIEVAIILSALIQHYEDFFIILALLLLNAVVGFWEENRAANAIELLKQKLAVTARVLRDDSWSELAARQLVPGDIIRVRLGDVVPADVKLTSGAYLLLDESGLTGESLPVEKHASDVAYSGSVVRQGEMDALVVTTGMATYFGKTARLVEEAKTRSHFQKAVIRIGDYLIAIAIALATLIIIVAYVRQESLLAILQFALVLTVAGIPVALPAVLSVTMAVGAIALAKKEAIVSKLVAIEEMAGVDVLCSDKTGTITKNELTLADVRPLEGFTASDVLLYGSLASRAEDQDPIDAAILAKAGVAVYNATVSDSNGTYAVSVRAFNTTQAAQAQFLSLRNTYTGQGYSALFQNSTAWSGFNASARMGAAVEYGTSPLIPYYMMVITGGAVGQAPFQQTMWQDMWDEMHEHLGNYGGMGPYMGYGLSNDTINDMRNEMQEHMGNAPFGPGMMDGS
ncbi:MAG: HAD-IC family P-type ATPase [Halobacteriota archaeon]